MLNKHAYKAAIKSFMRNFLPALLVAIIFRSVLYEPYKIPSGSMNPNLIKGDYILLSKSYYGISHHAFPFSPPLFSGRIAEFHKPQRGEVIVFRLPKKPSMKYIKRLIGVPGDKIQLIRGVLYINGESIRQEFVSTYSMQASIYRETLPNGVSYHILQEHEISYVDNTPVYTVPANSYFVLGDNRQNSKDSRFLQEVGYIPEENLLGKAQLILVSSEAPFLKLWEWIYKFNLSRVMLLIHKEV